jgi:hypothetical protein
VVSFTPQLFYPKEKHPSTHWIGGWVRSRAGLDTVVSRKILSPAGTQTPIIQPVAQRYTTELSQLLER